MTAAWAWGSEPLGSGASETQHPCHPQPPSLLPTPPCQAERSAAPRRLGVFVREAISEGVLWLGRPRERDGHECREGEYTLVSSRFTKTAHPACPPPTSLCPSSSRPHGLQSPNRDTPPPPVPRKLSTPWPRASPAQKWGSWHGVPPVPVHGSVILPHLPKMSRRLGRIVKEAASTVAKKAALAQPREPPGRPRTGSGGEGTPHFSSQDGWGPRELAARLRARRIPLGTAGFLG